MKYYDVVFVTIAERDVDFFLNIAKNVNGHVAFLSLYEPGDKKLKKNNFDVYQVSNLLKEKYKLDKNYDDSLLEKSVNHESLTFDRSKLKLKKKYIEYFSVFNNLFSNIRVRYIVQELGGFIGPISIYNVAIKNSINHIFLEPSIIAGRLIFLHNKLNYKIKDEIINNSESKFAKTYYLKILNDNLIIKSVKDNHHYIKNILFKVFNFTNFKKLTKKIFYKILGLHQEYDATYNYVKKYLNCIYNAHRSKKIYSNINEISNLKKIIFFPLHVKLDFTLTIRSPQFLDQFKIIETLCNNYPKNIILIKEHPAMVGMFDYNEILKLKKKYKNFYISEPSIYVHQIFKFSKNILTINSKVGFEAACFGLNVFCLSKSSYSNLPNVKLLNFNDLMIGKYIFSEKLNHTQENLSSYLIEFIEKNIINSVKTELYFNEETNIKNFSNNINKLLFDEGVLI